MKKFPIDLSCLTEEEISQFQEDPYTLYNGDQNVAIYLRYSSTGQSDQSIEGQLRDCRTFCKANHYRIVAIYVDRATTARKDVEKRVHLMEMISDSAKQNWEYVIVWKLDRFARNRNDSAIMKMRLRKNGVKVLSATEHLTDSPESIILESVLEGMAEFFSAELSQKVTRGMRESALKCHSVGGHIPLGYKVENHKLVIDPDTAHIVQEAFSLYANGESVADICRKFNSAGYKTAKNTEFNRSSFKAMFRNARYIGTYTYKDIVIENGIPAIIDKELFETVQRRLSKTATAPARGKAKVDYLLSGKLFCGHCGASMNGESGAGRHGKVYHYYSCYTKKRKLGCDKRPLKKDYIEGIVARDALNLLTDQLIDEIADMAIRQSEQDLINDTHIPQLTAQLSEVEKSITNITAAIEKGIASETLMNRLVQLEHEKKTINKEIKAEEKFVYRIDRDQIVFWLSQFKYGNIEDEDFRRRLIDLLVNSVTVWDEPDGYKITTAYNLTSCKTKTFRVEKNPAAEEATGFDFGESECTNYISILYNRLRCSIQTNRLLNRIASFIQSRGRALHRFADVSGCSRKRVANLVKQINNTPSVTNTLKLKCFHRRDKTACSIIDTLNRVANILIDGCDFCIFRSIIYIVAKSSKCARGVYDTDKGSTKLLGGSSSVLNKTFVSVGCFIRNFLQLRHRSIKLFDIFNDINKAALKFGDGKSHDVPTAKLSNSLLYLIDGCCASYASFNSGCFHAVKPLTIF